MVIRLAEGVQGLFPQRHDEYRSLTSGDGGTKLTNGVMGGRVAITGNQVFRDCILVGINFNFRISAMTAPSWDYWIEINLNSGTIPVFQMTESSVPFSTGQVSKWFTEPIHMKKGNSVTQVWYTPAGTITIACGWFDIVVIEAR